MTSNLPERVFVTDTVEAKLQFVDEDDERVELTDDFSLDEQTTVQVENEQWTDAFGTDTFYRFEPVVARPLKQQYTLDGDSYLFEKREQELKDAQWQIDNLPWTIGHPSGPTGRRVQSTDDIRGFWRKPSYEDGTGQRARLYVPDNDEEAHAFIEDNPDLSPGFGCDIDWTDDDDVDGIQRNMVYDHIASVRHGRCSRDSEEGCSLETTVADAADIDGHAVGGCTPGECSCGLHVHDEQSNTGSSASSGGLHTDTITEYDRHFVGDGSFDVEDAFVTDKSVAGVSFEGTRHGKLDRSEIPNDGYESHYLFPEDTKSESSYPVVDGDGFLRRGNVQSAWKLGARGGISGEELDSKLEQLNEEFEDKPIDPNKFNDSTMTDDSTNDNLFQLDDMKADAVVDEHDGVAELIDQKDATIDSLKQDKADLEDELEDLRSFRDDIQSERRQELVDEITDLTDYWSEDEMLGVADDAEPTDVEVLEERREALSDAAVEETTPGDGGTTTDSTDEEPDGEQKYKSGKSYNLSSTA